MDVTEELAALRVELAELKKQVGVLCYHLGLEADNLTCAPPYCSLEAETLGIRDGRMEIPIILKAEEGSGFIYMNDKKHIGRGILEVNEGGASFQLHNAQGKVIVTIGEAPDGSGMIFVHDKEGKPRAGLKANESRGTVTTLNGAGVPQALLLARDDGGEVLLVDAESRTRVKLHSSAEGGTVVVNEPSGRAVAYMTSRGDRGTFSVYNETGDQVGALSSDLSGGVLLLYDNDKTVRMSLPPIGD